MFKIFFKQVFKSIFKLVVQRPERDNVEICLNSTCPAASDLLTFQLGNRNPIEFISSHYTNQFDRTPFIDIDKNAQDICMNCHSKGSNRIDSFWFAKVNLKSPKNLIHKMHQNIFFYFLIRIGEWFYFYSDAICCVIEANESYWFILIRFESTPSILILNFFNTKNSTQFF